tara:strand:- start:460 stop:864 length:405 start_codon:yes stop_codon:yes gene_type:complete
MKTASKRDIAAFTKRRYTYCEIPELELRVRIQSLTEREKAGYETAVLSKSGRGVSRRALLDATRRLCVLCMVDEKGERLFGENDVEALADVDAFVITKISKACEQHVGMGDGDIEQLAKNSVEMHADDLVSSSA